MKKYLTMTLAALMLCAMSFSFAGNAWAGMGDGLLNSTLTPPTVKNPSSGSNTGGSTDPQTSVNSNRNSEQTKDSTSGGHTLNWNIGYDKDAGGGFLGKLLSGSSIGGSSGKSHSNAGAYNSNAGTLITNSNGGAANIGTVNGGGGGGYGGINFGNIGFGGGSGIFSTALNKLLNLFGNVKLILYVIAAFGLVGFAFMAIFGKVRWGWVCALAFGLAAVAAAGQIIDYVSQSGMGSTMGDTLGANAADFSTIN